MAILDTILELTSQLDDEKYKDVRESIVANVKNLNQERGRALSDLGIFKAENDNLKGINSKLEKTTLTFQELSKALSKNGLTPDQIGEMADKLQIKKGMEDELAEAKRVADDLSKELKDLKKEGEQRKMQDALIPKLKTAMEEFKDKDGKPIKLVDDFIPYDKLYKQIDVENEALVNDRLAQVLNEALSKQVDFQKRTGMEISGNPVHQTGENGDRHFSGEKALDIEKYFKSAQEQHGSIDSVAAILEAASQMKE